MDSSIIENQEEEISLIDLFAVVLRYRKLIVGGTLLGTLLAAVCVFAVPRLFPREEHDALSSVSEPSYCSVSYTVFVQEMPDNVQRVLVSGYRGQGTALNVGSVGRQFLDSLQNNESVEAKVSDTTPNQYTLTLKVPSEQLAEADTLAQAVIADSNKQVYAFFAPKLYGLLDNIQKLAATGKSYYNEQFTLTELQLAAMGYVNTLDTAVLLQATASAATASAATASAATASAAKKIIIAFFASLFVFVFIAFACNAVANIKKDPEASKTIADAWQAGK